VRGRNPRHRAIRADNVLYPRAPDEDYRPGGGLTRAATAMLESFRLHRRAARSRDARRAAAGHQARVRVIGTWPGPAADGSPGLVVDVLNGSGRPLAAVAMSLAYWADGAMVFVEDCRGRVAIPPGASGTLRCPRQGIETDRIEPRVVDVTWR